MDDELYFDLQGSMSTERFAELLARIAAGVMLTWFSLNELADELNNYRALRRRERMA